MLIEDLISPVNTQIIRIYLSLIFIILYVFIEFNWLPGRSYKINPKLKTTGGDISFYLGWSLANLIGCQLTTIIIMDHLFGPLSQPGFTLTQPFSLWGFIWKPVAYMFLFDTLSFFLHALAHYVFRWMSHSSRKIIKRLHKYLVADHRVHHRASYTYAWNGFYGSWLEAIMAVVTFNLPLYWLSMDPYTFLMALTLFHWCATNLHCGYDFPWMFHNWFPFQIYHGSRGHWRHHQLLNKNIGIFFTFYDYLFDTLYIE